MWRTFADIFSLPGYFLLGKYLTIKANCVMHILLKRGNSHFLIGYPGTYTHTHVYRPTSENTLAAQQGWIKANLQYESRSMGLRSLNVSPGPIDGRSGEGHCRQTLQRTNRFCWRSCHLCTENYNNQEWKQLEVARGVGLHIQGNIWCPTK